MNLTETPEYITWPETHYVFVERVGPFMQTAPEAWGQAHGSLPALSQSGKIVGYLSMYKRGPQIYRAGFAFDKPPASLPEGMNYELFPGGPYARFTLTGPYSQLGEASGRTWQMAKEQGLALRDDFNIENYVNNPKDTLPEALVTEILFPAAQI